ncbi:MAG: MFS transporter [Chloroflexota bacterium]
MIHRLQSTFREYPRSFWVLVGASFIDGIGRTIVMPFFALYVTQRFGVGMTEAGALFAVFSVAGFAGNMMGGGLTDRLGRKGIVLFGLVVSALSSLSMGLVNRLSAFYLLAGFVGLLSDVAGPAHGAMVADLLPERQRAEGFGILRVAGNLSWIVGPTIGGILAARSFFLLFVLDAICSLITAGVVLRLIPETRPEARQARQRESMATTFAGYRRVLRHGDFVAFLLTAAIMNVVYLQLYSTLSVYLRDVHAISTREYGYLMSMNATMVVLLQFWVTRQVRRFRPLAMMALGTLLYLIGFTLFGLVSAYALFVAAMLTVTAGEMIVIPVSQSLVANFAPEEMRGRYMAVFGLSWGVPAAVGPWAAGLVLDNYNPNWVWYLAGMLSALAAASFLALDLRRRARERPAIA